MLRKLIQVGAIVALSTTAAYSQPGSNNGNTPSGSTGLSMAPNSYGPRLSPEERQQQQEIESKYRDTVNQIPDKKGSNDPWGSVRSAPAKTSSTAKHKQP